MKAYSGLSKERVMDIHKFVIEKRKEGGIGQRKLAHLVKEKFGINISENTISNWIFNKKIPFENEKTQFKPKPKPEKKEIYKDYTNQKQSAQKLAKKYNVSPATIINWLKSYGIQTRDHIESMNTIQIKNELRERKLKRPTKDYGALTPEKAYIFGVLCGDGCLTKKMVRLEIRKDEDFIKEFVNCFEKVYGLKYKYFYYKPKNTFVAQISSTIVSQDIAKYSIFNTKNWKVPNKILESKNENIIGSFLRGFYDSEGSVSKGSITSSSINKNGLEEIAYLLNKLGITTTLRSEQNGRYHLLYIFRKGRFKIFKDKVGFQIKRKMDKVNETLNRGFFSKKSMA